MAHIDDRGRGHNRRGVQFRYDGQHDHGLRERKAGLREADEGHRLMEPRRAVVDAIGSTSPMSSLTRITGRRQRWSAGLRRPGSCGPGRGTHRRRRLPRMNLMEHTRDVVLTADRRRGRSQLPPDRTASRARRPWSHDRCPAPSGARFEIHLGAQGASPQAVPISCPCSIIIEGVLTDQRALVGKYGVDRLSGSGRS